MSEEHRRPRPTLERRRQRQRQLHEFAAQELVLDRLRGWREGVDATLDSEHILPRLASLTGIDPGREAAISAKAPISSSGDLLDENGPSPLSWDVRAPEVMLGRYSQQIGPTDITFHGALDHELYTLHSPHAKLAQIDAQTWHLTRLSPQAIVAINDEVVTQIHKAHPITHGDVITLGVLRMRFDVNREIELHTWRQKQRDLLRTQQGVALFLKRHGGLCGPRFTLPLDRACVIGRSFPASTSLHYPLDWPPFGASDWNLSGLPDHERRHIGFRHVSLRPIHDQDWEISPLSNRLEVTVNRISIRDAMPLKDGDEIGLGNVLFHFHNPMASQPSTRHTIKLPSAVDWHSEHSSLIPLPRHLPLGPEREQDDATGEEDS